MDAHGKVDWERVEQLSAVPTNREINENDFAEEGDEVKRRLKSVDAEKYDGSF